MAHEMFDDLPFLNMVISIAIIYVYTYHVSLPEGRLSRTFSIPPTGEQANPKVHYFSGQQCRRCGEWKRDQLYLR